MKNLDYNVIIANFMKFTNFLEKKDENKNYENLLKNYTKILMVMSPVVTSFFK